MTLPPANPRPANLFFEPRRPTTTVPQISKPEFDDMPFALWLRQMISWTLKEAENNSKDYGWVNKKTTPPLCVAFAIDAITKAFKHRRP